MAGKKGQNKRVWLDDEKRSICAQARVTACASGFRSDTCETTDAGIRFLAEGVLTAYCSFFR
jgi:hypothetical protein